MWSPLTNGATLVYLSYLKPLYRTHEVKILEASKLMEDFLINSTGWIFEMIMGKLNGKESVSDNKDEAKPENKKEGVIDFGAKKEEKDEDFTDIRKVASEPQDDKKSEEKADGPPAESKKD